MCIAVNNTLQVRESYDKIVYKVVNVTSEGSFVSPISTEFVWLSPYQNIEVFKKGDNAYISAKESSLQGQMIPGGFTFTNGLIHTLIKRPTRGGWLGSCCAVLPLKIVDRCIVDESGGTVAARTLVWDGRVVAMGRGAFIRFEAVYKNRLWPQIKSNRSASGYKFIVCNKW